MHRKKRLLVITALVAVLLWKNLNINLWPENNENDAVATRKQKLQLAIAIPPRTIHWQEASTTETYSDCSRVKTCDFFDIVRSVPLLPTKQEESNNTCSETDSSRRFHPTCNVLHEISLHDSTILSLYGTWRSAWLLPEAIVKVLHLGKEVDSDTIKMQDAGA